MLHKKVDKLDHACSVLANSRWCMHRQVILSYWSQLIQIIYSTYIFFLYLTIHSKPVSWSTRLLACIVSKTNARLPLCPSKQAVSIVYRPTDHLKNNFCGICEIGHAISFTIKFQFRDFPQPTGITLES